MLGKAKAVRTLKLIGREKVLQPAGVFFAGEIGTPDVDSVVADDKASIGGCAHEAD
jgi:hypothetical protein